MSLLTRSESFWEEPRCIGSEVVLPPPGCPVWPCLTPRYLEKAGGHRVRVEHGTIEGHPLADKPQDLLPLVTDVGAVLLLAAP